MKIAIGNDHAAVELKQQLVDHLKSQGHQILNYGTDILESCDYPLFAERVSLAVLNCEADLGIVICGTGIGVSIAANKIPGIRAVACSEPFSAKLSRQHNDSNVLALGARVVGVELAKMIVDEWLSASFEGGRHVKRLDMISEIEKKYHLVKGLL